ncbi:MAG: uroporphyrinogen-III C-methyltransferase [Gammaproteobacteria bacterium]|nr:uroporphyrinogen-III C-methyltransferase [Gammaproteobacteria bacterium]
MFYLPLLHNLQNARCLVVGAGSTALRKINWLVRAEADVWVVAPAIDPEIRRLAANGSVNILEKEFEVGCLAPTPRLVICATNDAGLNETVYLEASRLGVLVNCVDDPNRCTFIFPAIVDRFPIIIAVSSMGVSPTLARVVRGWIEQRLPPALGELATFAGSLREQVKSQLKTVSARMTFWDRLFVGNVPEMVFQGKLQQASAAANQQLCDNNAEQGSIALVGAGPGDPELLTIKALRLIQTADVVLFDKLVNPLVLNYARRDAKLIDVGKQGPKPGALPTRSDNRSNQQSRINQLLIEHAKLGRHVVRLKGGDPFIYGRGGEELEAASEAGFDVLVVPGITASIGAASYVGIPLTYRNLSQSVRFVTGHRVENTVNLDWPEFAKPDQTLVIYMGLVGLAQIMSKLIEHGSPGTRPVALVENATLPEQRVVIGCVENIANKVAQANIQGPSVVIVGDVVGHARI